MISFTLVIAAAVRLSGAFLTSGVVVVVDMRFLSPPIMAYYSKILASYVTQRSDVQPKPTSAICLDATLDTVVAINSSADAVYARNSCLCSGASNTKIFQQ